MKIAKGLFLVMLVFATVAMAQYPRVTIQQIQTVPLGRDSSFMAGDTVVTGGQVVAGTGLFYAGTGVTFYIESPEAGQFSGIMVYDPSPQGVPPLVPGDSILVTAWVHEYGWSGPPAPFVTHTELEVLPGQFDYRLFGMPEPNPEVITASVIDSSQDHGQFVGEPYESVFTRINNLVCDTVYLYGSQATWICHDSTGTCCVREASDSINGFQPDPGTRFEFVQGVIYHRFGAYMLQPRYMRDMPLAAGAPIISNVQNIPRFPLVNDLVTLSANVYDDSQVDTVRLFYRINNGSWSNVPMTNGGGNIYTFQLPSPQVGWKVDYYIHAVDDSNLARNNPYEAPNSFYGYVVQQPRVMTIAEARIDENFDFVPDKKDTAAILTGIAVSPNFSNTTTNFFMQQGNAGIEVYFDSLINVTPGDSITVNGIIGQSNGDAEISLYYSNRLVNNGSGHLPETTLVNCAQLRDTVGESNEGKLIRINNVKIVPTPNGWPVYGANANMTIVQGPDSATLFISQWTDIDGQIQQDSMTSIVGVLNQHDLYSPYSGYYEFEPRYYSDFTWGAAVGCHYTPGDINGNHSVNGVDIVYAVNYLKGTGPVPPVDCGGICPEVSPFFAAGDVNGNCAFNGIDITFFVRFLKGQVPSLLNCTDCPPAPLAGPAGAPMAPTVIRPAVVPSLKSNSISHSRSSE
jgi:hypothetical protein